MVPMLFSKFKPQLIYGNFPILDNYYSLLTPLSGKHSTRCPTQIPWVDDRIDSSCVMNTAASPTIPSTSILAECFFEAATRLLVPIPTTPEDFRQTLPLVKERFTSPFWDHIHLVPEEELLQRSSQKLRKEPLQSRLPKLRSETDVWHQGAVFTPSSVATAIIKQTIPVPGTLADKQLTYLDPSCGAGSFLVAILRHFLAARADVSLPATVEFLSNQLYGCDVDEEAIAVAEFLLHLEVVAHFGPSANQVLPPLRHNTLVVDDFLLPSQPLWLAGADYIFGNPPFGLSRQGRLGASYAAKLRRVYRHHNFGKINSYLLFLAKSYEVLKSNGTLCLITPNAWLGIDSAKTFRQMLLQTGSLSRIQSCGRTLFEDQGVETVIVTVKKEANINTVCLEEATNRLEPITSSHISRQVLLERPAATIPIQWRPALCPVFASMMANSIPLKSQNSPYSPQIALQEYKEGLGTPPQSREVVSSRAFHANAPKTPEHIPFLLGRDIGRYHIAWSGTYLRYGPWLSHPGDISRYQQPRVVIREVTNSRPFLIQACAIRNTFVYNKSVLHIPSSKPNPIG